MERTELNLDSWVEGWGKVNTFSSKGQRDSLPGKNNGRCDIKIIEDRPIHSCHKAITSVRENQRDIHCAVV